MGFTEPHWSPNTLVRSYRTVSPLPTEIGGLLSVALSCESPRLAVSQHPALWSPDLPQSLRSAITRSPSWCTVYGVELFTQSVFAYNDLVESKGKWGVVKTEIHRIPKPIGALLVLIAIIVIVMVGGALAQNGSLGERSWQYPAVGHTVNGYAGAPVGSPIYHSQQ